MQGSVILYTPEADAQAHALCEALNNEPVLAPVQGEQALLEKLAQLAPHSQVYAFLTDPLMRLALAHAGQITLLPMPWRDNPQTRSGLLLASSWREQLKRWQDESLPEPLTRLPRANGRLLLHRASVGTPLQPPGKTLWEKLRWGVRTLRRARLRAYTLFTAKGQQVSLAAFNLQVGDSAALHGRFSRLCPADTPATGKLAALIFSPQSITQFFQLSLKRWLPRKNDRLPPGVGLVRSERLTIQSETPFPYRADEEPFMTEKLEIEYAPLKCALIPGRPLMADGTERETLRLDQIPTGEEAISFYHQRPLPLFPHAGESAFAELFAQIRQGAQFSTSFGVLLVLSVLLATLGLFQNSSPVIIGAMILAPLMAPIVSLAMGLIRLDSRLMRQSARTVALGTALSVGLAAVFAWAMPFGHMTDQMASRTHPTLLDLGVAIISGLAAAYAYSREEVAKSLAGVAIAVALVPPLAVAGIGLGWADWQMFKGAFLLFLANLVGIIVAAGLLFYVLGYSSLRAARTALIYKLALLVAIMIPLGLTTRTLLEEERLYQRLNHIKTIGWQQHRLPVQITGVRIEQGQPMVQVRVVVPPQADARARERLAEHLQSLLGPDVHLVIDFRTFYPAKSGQ